ncbi:unnamed protein product [Meloidogyne enterolobii]|uniref:Uncharacterized protein n=1 Tax=Meloidogyne enterolobii TaxID=390850 RepID=A0ACB0YNI2_MELEN
MAHSEAIPSQTGGLEGSCMEPGCFAGKSMAVFTSGGDSSGMNSAVRSVVRTGLYFGCRVFFIKEGYDGMVKGGDNILEANWNSVSDIIQWGGTIIGSARCKEFRERPGRRISCKNLIAKGITHLVCIGGDGSLTGANTFRQEWPSLVKELLDAKEITEEQAKNCANIQIVGLVGSIDNDFCGTDMTIGTDTALQRIVEAIDSVVSTAQSHQRAFVIEVMGRHCGYLALVASLASEADFCFIPEWPQPVNWEEVLCKKLENSRELNQRLNIMIVAEGAIDREGTPISSEKVCNSVKTRLGYDTRITVLGHVQRGGSPSTFDRLLGCRMGAEATLALMQMTPESEPSVISTDSNQMVRVPLMECVRRTQDVSMDAKNFEKAVHLRGQSFQRNLNTYRLLTKLHTPKEKDNLSGGVSYNVAVMNVGAPAGGMNAAVRAFVRMALYHRCKVFGINNAFEGLAEGKIEELDWEAVAGWGRVGGSKLGTQKQLPTKYMDQIAVQLKKYQIQALLIVGGFEAFHSALILSRNKEQYPEFAIPICVVPCTISNNVPGTSLSLGSDTALNEICRLVDNIKQSANGTKRRVFIIETMGGHCGYLATFAALATGADNAYIFEERFTADDIKEDVKVIAEKMKTGVQRYLIVQSEGASANYNTDFVDRLFREEGKGEFSTRVNILGGRPTPFDRNLGAKFGIRALEHLLELLNLKRKGDTKTDCCGLLGLVDRALLFTPVEELASNTDFDNRLPKHQWWLKVRPLLRILAKHQASYEQTAKDLELEESDSDEKEE